jgi:hypothetical protein
MTPTVNIELHDTTSDGRADDTLDATIDNNYASEVLPMRDNEASKRSKTTKVAEDIILLRNVKLAAPKAGIRCAGRKDTTRLL